MVLVKKISLIDASNIINELENAVLTDGSGMTANSGTHSVHGNCAIVTTSGEESFLISLQ